MATDTAAPPAADDYSVTEIRRALQDTLRGYIEAQYHVRDVSLIRERGALLAEPGTVGQVPFVEATPVYELGEPYHKLALPGPAKELLTFLAGLRPRVGVYDRPYVHQARALEEFLSNDRDLIVATGTGSGKTESFLMPILGQLAVEGAASKATAARRGVRAMLLYPMNALVADQLARVRRLLGRPEVAAYLEKVRGRRVQFGMYTSRTPYPGPRDRNKDIRYIQPMFEDFYLDRGEDGSWRENDAVRKKLQPGGKWPCKDLLGFYAPDRVEAKTYGGTGKKAGTNYTAWNWDDRLRTQPGDAELLTRHEMQAACPDLLITNYSMLEYMLLRPIEESIFRQTREWLASDPSAVFVLVLDEAHTYRGAGGAEVALLIRRLRARLGIPRERFRCILTSASLDKGYVVKFAQDLTGLEPGGPHRFELVEGTPETRRGRSPGTPAEAAALAAFDLPTFHRFSAGETERAAATAAVAALASALGWPAPGSGSLEEYLYARMTGWGPLEEAVARISGQATEFSGLAADLFPGSPARPAERATEVLLALATFARHGRTATEEGRVLMPTRLHLFYRGLPALYACTSPACTRRRTGAAAGLLGRFYTEPRLHCDCGARTYELYTHRHCGTAFLRAYLEGRTGDFAWHEPSGLIGSDAPAAQLTPVHMLVEKPHPDADRGGEVVPHWLDTTTGCLRGAKPEAADGWLQVYLPALRPDQEDHCREFSRCPVCRKEFRGRPEIMDLVTKGEAPFSNLVKAQVLAQPPRSRETHEAPNGGRKSLLFSDGRQKAARLARDIPREVEQDSFRQALALAVLELAKAKPEARPTKQLYIAFVKVVARYHLAFFDGDDQQALIAHAREFEKDHGGDLEAAFDYPWEPTPPPSYHVALMRQLCNRYYSLASTTIGHVGPARKNADKFADAVGPLLTAVPAAERRAAAAAVATAWVTHLLQEDMAFDDSIKDPATRDRAAGFPRDTWGSDGKVPPTLKKILVEAGGLSEASVGQVEKALQSEFCKPADNALWLDPGRLAVRVDLAANWWQCLDCTHLSPVTVLSRCANCGGKRVDELTPASEYIRSRKGFWRDALRQIVDGTQRPAHVCAEEHTAQLSHRDEGVVHATTERHELRFQDIVLDGADRDRGPIDVLSCTTTMEVGIDIGSLVAVGLRNVPPQRENYQQRAGRAGRRGAAVSTVVTYAQGGPHDNYYYQHPREIVSGLPRRPVVHTDNPRIATRHVRAYLIQTFFHETLAAGARPPGGQSARLESALGRTADFFLGTESGFILQDFAAWAEKRVLQAVPTAVDQEFDWLPAEVHPGAARYAWVRGITADLLTRFDGFTAGLKPDPRLGPEDESLLDYLFNRGLLPSYAFPTDLASFLVEGREGKYDVVERERPQLATNQALSEYAPGRLVVINKLTYRSGGVVANVPPTELDRAAPLFARRTDYVYCTNPECRFVGPPVRPEDPLPAVCKLCDQPDVLARRPMVTPEVFVPERARPVPPTDREQDISYASSAQFPVPADGADLTGWAAYRGHAEVTYAENQALIVVNRGDKEGHDGFWVCGSCGCAELADDRPPPVPHVRPYLYQPKFGERHPGNQCRGRFEQVYLGNQFRSDLMVLRMTLSPPFHRNRQDKVFASALDDAAQTFAEALTLAASKQLDVDPAEFGSGYREWLPTPDKRLRFDVYLFDTLAGGGGYAEQAGEELDGVLGEMRRRLSECKCDTSCQTCLRHYGNRIHHERLDRHLALQLLDYVLEGRLPSTADLDLQVRALAPLQRMLELQGISAALDVMHHGVRVPLLVKTGGGALAVGSYPGLLDEDAEEFTHPVHALDGVPKTDVCRVNEYQLTRNLPGAYLKVAKRLKGK